jgi:hypothetical protein
VFFTFVADKCYKMRKKQDNDKLPGYPHYPASEDITQPGNNNGKEILPEDRFVPKQSFNDTIDEEDTDVAIIPGTEADVTVEDLRILESSEQNMDTRDGRNLISSALDNTDDDGEPLNEDGCIIDDVSGGGLDVPGSEYDDLNEQIGEEDEENNYYSLGGDNHESQEENKGE